MKILSNIICLKKVKYSIFILFLLFIYIFFSALSYVTAVSNNLQNNIFRLHVIANSDSDEDQQLKYLVRDSLLEYMNNIVPENANKEQIIVIAKNHLNEFLDIARKTVLENGYDYDIFVEVGNYDFPTKTYGDISFPAGFYDALRVKIGNAKGQNWWCVMFPPLCFVNISSGAVPDDSKKILENQLSEEGYNLISSDNNEFKLKFKIVELFQNKSILTAKK